MKKTNRTACKGEPTKLLLVGKHPEKGWPRFALGALKFHGLGELVEIDEFDEATNMDVRKKGGLSVYCERAEKTFRFDGALLPSSSARAEAILKNLVAPQAEPLLTTMEEESRGLAHRAEAEWFVRELKRLRALQDDGIDPPVSMRFFATYIGESSASLTRKIGSEIPKPTKRGGRNFWLKSHVDAYLKSGKPS